MPFVLNEAIVIIKSQGLPKLNSDLKATDVRIKKVAETIDKTFGRLTKVRSAPFERLTKGVRSYGRAARTYNKDVETFAKSTRMLTDALEKALPTMQRAARSLNSIADSSKVARRNISSFGGSFGKLAQQTQSTNRAFNQTGRQTAALTHRFLQISGATKTVEGQFLALGSAFLGGFGIPAAVDLTAKTIGVIANTIGDSVKSAASLESRLAEIATISSDVAENMSGFADVLGEMSVATRTDVGLLSEGLYQTISSGITNTSDALQFLETSANAARAGLTTVEVAVDGLSSTVNAFGFEATQVGDVADKFFKTVELGKLRFNDLARGIGLVAPLAVELGVSLEELLAAGAALTAGGNTLAQSFTAVRGVLNAVLRPSEKATKRAREMGLEFSVSALRTKGLAGFLRDLTEQTGGNAEIMGQLIPRVEGLRGILALTGNQAEKFEQNLQDINNATGSTDKALNILNKTFEGQVALLNQQLNNALRIVGQELLPDVTSAVKDLSRTLEDVDWKQFREDVRSTIETLKGLYNIVQLITNITRGVINPPNTLRQGLQAGPAARAALAKGELPTLKDEIPTPGAGGRSDREILREIALQFSRDEVLSQDALDTLKKIGDGTSITKALKDAGITKDGLAEAIAQRVKVSTQRQPTPQVQQAPNRALPLSSTQQKQLDKILSPANVIEPGSITSDPRTFLKPAERSPVATQRPPIVPELGSRFTPPKAIPTAKVTRSPIPGVEGQLVSPGLGVATPDAASVFQKALEGATSNELDNIATNTKRVSDILEKDLGPAQDFLDAQAQAKRDAERRGPSVPPAFGQGGQYVGFPEFKAQREAELRTQQREGVSDVLKGSAEQLASNFSLVSSAIQGGAAGGLPGALIAVGAELLQMTPSFSRITEGFNGVIEKLVMAIEPVVSALADVLAPVFDALGAVASALAPVFQLLGKILKTVLTPAAKVLGLVLNGLSKVINFLANTWIKIANFVIGLLNKLPFVDIKKIPEVGNQAGTPPAGNDAVDTPVGEGTGNINRAENTTRGIQVSRITGPTRDVFVDLLRPLRQLDSTFPAMLEVLKNIEMNIAGSFPMAVPAAGMVPRQPNLAGVINARQNDVGADFGGIAGVGASRGGIVVEQLHIHVDQVADLNVDELQQQLLDNLDVRDRNGGAVFPNNR